MLSSNFKTSLYCRENILKGPVPSLAFLLYSMFIYTNSLLVRLFSTSGSLPIWGKQGNVSRGQFYQVCLTFLLALSGFTPWKPRNANKRWNVLNTSLGWFATIKVFHSSPTGRCTDLQIQFTEAVSAVAEQKDLIAKLEHDLSTIQSLSAMHRPDAEVSPWRKSCWLTAKTVSKWPCRWDAICKMAWEWLFSK